MDNKSIKFAVFADFHYKKGMYASTVSDLEEILANSSKNKVDFVLSLGDFCNDYKGSPEVVDALLNNPYNLPVYGIYGNHELESLGNTMQVVTPLITNQTPTFGTIDGQIGDGSIAYYYFDYNGFRFICLDTNYSYNPTLNAWEHNKEASWGSPEGNVHFNALGPVQFSFLSSVLTDAGERGLKCIVVTHADLFDDKTNNVYEAKAVRELFSKINKRYKNTVLMSINGHRHLDNFMVLDGIAYFDVNAVKNGFWKHSNDFHYQSSNGFTFADYDHLGKETFKKFLSYNELSQGKNTWFFVNPLYAIVTLNVDGDLTIKGTSTKWADDVTPQTDLEGVKPCILDINIKL